MNDEDIPYRSAIPQQVVEKDEFTTDEQQQGTLNNVYKVLKESIENLDKWHAFDCRDTDLKIKQHIHAHKMAFDIVAPAYEAVEQALAIVDQKFRERNKK